MKAKNQFNPLIPKRPVEKNPGLEGVDWIFLSLFIAPETITAEGGETVVAEEVGIKALRAAPARLTQQGLEHIVERHWFTSGAKGAGKFLEGTTESGLKDMIETTTTNGLFRANTLNRAGTIAEYDFESIIGTTSSGAPASSLRVVIGPNGDVITAFPF